MTPEEAKAVVLRWLGPGWSEGDYAALRESVAPDATIEALGSGTASPYGPDQAEAMTRHWRDSFDDYRYTVHELVAERDAVVALTTFSGVLAAPFTMADGRTVQPGGQPISVPEVIACRVAGGKIVQVRVLLDRHAFLRQMGIPPTP